MGLSEIQISVTALFLLTAVAIVVLCDLLRRKRKGYCKVTRRNSSHPLPRSFEQPSFTHSSFDHTAKEVNEVSFSHEIAALTAAGMREENSAWMRIEPVYNPFEVEGFHQAPAQPEQAHPVPVPVPIPVPVPVPDSSTALQLPAPTVDQALFESLLSGRSAPELPSAIASEPAPAPVLPINGSRFTGSRAANPPLRPRGMLDGLTLEQILKTNKPFTGVAVSISVTGAEGRPLGDGQLDWVATFVDSLLDENDYGCRIAREEFVIACPGVQRAEAQQRLNDISQRLWEFQLRGIGTTPWYLDGVASRPEMNRSADALASAIERMHLNQAHPQPDLFACSNAHKQVV